MAMIPTPVYQLVERRLHQREGWLKRLEEAEQAARQRATDPHAPSPDREPSGHRQGRENRRLDAAVEAAEAAETARRWLRVFERVDRAFPPESATGRVAVLMYREGLTQEDTARRLGKGRQYVRRQRDIYVCHCAVLAAAAGLIRLRYDQADKEART